MPSLQDQWMKSERLWLVKELDDSDLKGLPQYTEFKKRHTNTCIRCDKKFTFKVYDYDDPRFVRLCFNCKQKARNSDYEIDYTETIGN